MKHLAQDVRQNKSFKINQNQCMGECVCSFWKYKNKLILYTKQRIYKMVEIIRFKVY